MTGVADAERRHVLDAALAELAVKGVDLTVDGVAVRAGVDPASVRRFWPNSAELFAATIMESASRSIEVPDTGTLRGDLLAYAKSYAAAVNSPMGQRLIHALVVNPREWDLHDSRSAFLGERNKRIAVLVERGIQRGECSAQTDPGHLMDVLGVCLCMSIFFYGRPITDADCQSVVDLLLYGIAEARPSA